jgi:hypothetical protein
MNSNPVVSVRRPSVVIGELLDGIEMHGIRSIVDQGYRAEVPPELLALYEGDDGAARRAVQRLAYERVRHEPSSAVAGLTGRTLERKRG